MKSAVECRLNELFEFGTELEFLGSTIFSNAKIYIKRGIRSVVIGNDHIPCSRYSLLRKRLFLFVYTSHHFQLTSLTRYYVYLGTFHDTAEQAIQRREYSCHIHEARPSSEYLRIHGPHSGCFDSNAWRALAKALC